MPGMPRRLPASAPEEMQDSAQCPSSSDQNVDVCRHARYAWHEDAAADASRLWVVPPAFMNDAC